MFFKKNIICEQCYKLIPKKEIKVFDTRCDGRNKKRGIKKRICINCLGNEIYQVLTVNKFKSVLIAPMKKHNSYVYYNFSDLLKERASEHLAIDLEKLLPNDFQYCSCGILGQYSWCSPEILDNDPWNWQVINPKVSIEYLCKECAPKKILGYFKKQDFNIKYFYTYIKSEGFFTPWDI